MTTRTGGIRKKNRFKLQKRSRDKGKVKIANVLRTFKVGDRVRILQEPAVQKEMPHPHFKNLVGIVAKKQGKSYLINIKDINKMKQVISSAVHLKKVK